MMLSKNSTTFNSLADPNVVHLTIDIVLVLDLEIGRATALRLKDIATKHKNSTPILTIPHWPGKASSFPI